MQDGTLAKMAALSIKLGGLGFVRHLDVADVAFLTSWTVIHKDAANILDGHDREHSVAYELLRTGEAQLTAADTLTVEDGLVLERMKESNQTMRATMFARVRDRKAQAIKTRMSQVGRKVFEPMAMTSTGR